jgi:DNA-binding MarR family transcriptional regulator
MNVSAGYVSMVPNSGAMRFFLELSGSVSTDLTHRQLAIMALLYSNQGQQIGSRELTSWLNASEHLGRRIGKSVVTRVVASLSEPPYCYLERRKRKDDERLIQISITEAGIAFMRSLEDLWKKNHTP